ncbi:hypothetical protein [Pseudonocardia alni]|uniref:hypothetical protein n=1 Tax=Pseudonocardia alni TaxID=33907 RepID=UPI0027A683C7|nr:hypothetical protein PaSha_12855 [Pseudonocardia alni]
MTTLVATVGLSPAAVAYAVATLAPSRVVLVHTTGSAAEADRIATWALGRVDDVDRVHVGDGSAFVPTFDHLTRALLGGPDAGGRSIHPVDGVYQLDYTGGTKILTVCVVARHQADHGPGAAALRSWVDDAHGVVRHDDLRPATPTVGLPLAELADLHGVTLAGPIIRPRVVGVDATAILGTVAHDPEQTVRLHDQLTAVLGGAFPARRNVIDNPGLAFEMAAAAAVLALPGIDEIGLGLDVDADGARLTDLDVVVRRGSRVVVVEAKRRASDLLPDGRTGRHAGDQLALGRLVFGPATRTLLVTGAGSGPHDPDHAAVVQSLDDAAVRLAPTVPLGTPDILVAHVPLVDRAGVDEVGRILDAMSPLQRPARTPRRPRIERAEQVGVDPDPLDVARPNDTPQVYRELLVPVSGTVLGVAATIRGIEAGTVRLVGDTAVCRVLTERLPDDLGRRLGPPLVPETDRPGPPADRLPPAGTGALAVGPGPKRVTAALVVQALENDLDLVHVGVDGWVRSWRHGRWTAAGRVDWAEHLADTMRRVDRVPASVGHLVRLPDRADLSLLVPHHAEQVWLPDLLVGFADRCVGHVVPTDDRFGRGRVRAVAAHLARLVGDAAEVVVHPVNRVADPQAWRRLGGAAAWGVPVTVAGRP